MKYALVLTLLTALPATAQTLPEGLRSAGFLPGWTDAAGNRIAALELVLEPGWKTYWRSPGDAGLPPEFDWMGSNIAEVAFHWPAPEIIDSDGLRTLGYHDRLVLPFTVTPQDPDRPVGISAQVTFGLCENICIPAQLTLSAAGPGDRPDRDILAAMDAAPAQREIRPACAIGAIEDGMTVTLSLPEPGRDLAVEYLADPSVWVSAPELSPDGGEATVDLVAPSGQPFAVAADGIVMTLLGEDGASEFRGCAAA
ncbi:Thiol-disulfide interchange protein, contains DsbC and DsbD domains [Paracoccus isoporae]|uniref:Thiol-disulfide interchange protein, contains DsbC and DsbD domains n=1 Tax=Paracoccus isoporae TaxID=591205 RepID=A0A1G6Z2R0_9RHOB|nr:protein-disulfide reductase DsbD domain-containing protein [Paracoccus isoporae]SDD96782.1 Thiol-disulfide interchange protein, contains DsbC and DsbD domains [Paracoccus isoporae]